MADPGMIGLVVPSEMLFYSLNASLTVGLQCRSPSSTVSGNTLTGAMTTTDTASDTDTCQTTT
jgi:hypothetical protein